MFAWTSFQAFFCTPRGSNFFAEMNDNSVLEGLCEKVRDTMKPKLFDQNIDLPKKF